MIMLKVVYTISQVILESLYLFKDILDFSTKLAVRIGHIKENTIV